MNPLQSKGASFTYLPALCVKHAFFCHSNFYWLVLKSICFYKIIVADRNTDSTNLFYTTDFYHDMGKCVNASYHCHLRINKAKIKIACIR